MNLCKALLNYDNRGFRLQNFEQQKEQFDSFFLINYPIPVNLIPATDEQSKQSQEAFEETMPYAFKIAAELSEIESQALKPLRSLGDKLNDLVSFLQMQSRKIDLMMSYILLNEDDPEFKATAIKFGGGGLVVEHPRPFDIGDSFTVKIFLEKEAAAVYCQAQVIESVAKDDLFEVSYVYTHIREQDQELLVRASLHLQTNQLKKNKQKRDNL